MLCSPGPRSKTVFFLLYRLVVFYQQAATKAWGKPDGTGLIQGDGQSRLNVTTFLALIYLCVSIPTSESWETLPLTHLCVCFKSTWCWAEVLCSCTRRDTCFERNTAVSCSKPGPDLTTGPHLCRWSLEESENYLCFIPMLRSSPNGGICTLLAQLVPCAKECGRPCMSGLPLEISTPFLVPWWPVCLLTLKIPLLPSLFKC